jgi:methyltransferase
MSVILYCTFLGMVIVERFFELWLSSRNARQAFSAGAVEVGQRHFRVMSLMHTIFFGAILAELFVFSRLFSPILGYASLVIVILSQLLRYWAITTLGERWNVRIIVLPGVAPVVGGPYRFLRHPNYVAVIAEILFLPLVHGCYLTAVLFSVMNAVVLWVRIRAEEEALGALYQDAFREHNRFIPG